jgi:hypothetical protein
LHHDNALPHISFATRAFLTKSNITVVPHPLYSRDLALCDFSVLPRLNVELQSPNFESIEVIEAESQAVLNTFAEHDFQDAFNTYQNCWGLRVRAKGDYCEVEGTSRNKVIFDQTATRVPGIIDSSTVSLAQ